MMTAHEQTLSKSAIEAGVDHTSLDSRHRLCKEASEIVQHIVAGVRCRLGLEECTGASVMGMGWKMGWEIPPKMMENEGAKILVNW